VRGAVPAVGGQVSLVNLLSVGSFERVLAGAGRPLQQSVASSIRAQNAAGGFGAGSFSAAGGRPLPQGAAVRGNSIIIGTPVHVQLAQGGGRQQAARGQVLAGANQRGGFNRFILGGSSFEVNSLERIF